MSQDYGSEAPRAHTHTVHRPAARYLVVIEAGGTVVARLFLDTRELVGEFDAGSEETAQMTAGSKATKGADAPEWDGALAGHSLAERRDADIYKLDV
jgi:hypothetical protein